VRDLDCILNFFAAAAAADAASSSAAGCNEKITRCACASRLSVAAMTIFPPNRATFKSLIS